MLEVAGNDLDVLTPRQSAALELADAFVTDPARLGGELRSDALDALSAAEAVEVLFDVTAWSQQKVLVALALDAPVEAGALTALEFDAAGHAVIG